MHQENFLVCHVKIDPLRTFRHRIIKGFGGPLNRGDLSKHCPNNNQYYANHQPSGERISAILFQKFRLWLVSSHRLHCLRWLRLNLNRWTRCRLHNPRLRNNQLIIVQYYYTENIDDAASSINAVNNEVIPAIHSKRYSS